MIPDRWFVLGVRLPHGLVESGVLADGLLRLGGRAVEEEGEWLRTHLPPPEDPDAFLSDARRRLEELTGLGPLEVTARWQAHREWEEVWREGFRPRTVSPRIVVSPRWDSPEIEPGQFLITVDPGMAFGTGEHASTRGCLRLLDAVLEPGESVVDVGAGSGILAIAAVRLGAAAAVAIEEDAFACEAARENVEANGAVDEIRVVEARATPDRLERLEMEGVEPVHGILANIDPAVIVPLLAAFRRLVEDGGWLIVGGVPDGDEHQLVDAAEAVGFRLRSEDREDGWWSASFRAEGDPPSRS